MAEKLKIDDLLTRINEHLKHRGGDEDVKLLWKGYLAALMEWGFLYVDDYHELNNMLGERAQDGIREIFLGFPDH